MHGLVNSLTFQFSCTIHLVGSDLLFVIAVLWGG